MASLYGGRENKFGENSFINVLFECEKVDLTPEIKISNNVLSLFGAL